MENIIEFEGKPYKLVLWDKKDTKRISCDHCCFQGTNNCLSIINIQNCFINDESAYYIEANPPIKTELTIEDTKELYEGRVIYLVNGVLKSIEEFTIYAIMYDISLGFFLVNKENSWDFRSVKDYKVLGLTNNYNKNASFFDKEEAEEYLKTLENNDDN